MNTGPAPLHETPVFRLPVRDDPISHGAEGHQVQHFGLHDGVGQGEDPEHVAREPRASWAPLVDVVGSIFAAVG